MRFRHKNPRDAKTINRRLMEAGSGITRAPKVMLSNTSVFALPVKTTDLNAMP